MLKTEYNVNAEANLIIKAWSREGYGTGDEYISFNKSWYTLPPNLSLNKSLMWLFVGKVKKEAKWQERRRVRRRW